jgi:adenylyltransferase/sulfurtransferase
VAGILAPIVGVIASIEAVEAIKILSGNRAAVSRNLTVVELWDNHLRQVDVSGLRHQVECPACKHGHFPWLSGKEGSHTAVLCGRNAVQLTHPGVSLSLDELARRLDGVGRLIRNPFLLKLYVEQYELTVFPDGRAIIGGTDDVATAKTVYAKYVGS